MSLRYIACERCLTDPGRGLDLRWERHWEELWSATVLSAECVLLLQTISES